MKNWLAVSFVRVDVGVPVAVEGPVEMPHLVDQARQSPLQLERQIHFIAALRIKPGRTDLQVLQISDPIPTLGRHHHAGLEEDGAVLDADPQRPHAERDVERVLVIQSDAGHQGGILDVEVARGAVQAEAETQVQRRLQLQRLGLGQRQETGQVQTEAGQRVQAQGQVRAGAGQLQVGHELGEQIRRRQLDDVQGQQVFGGDLVIVFEDAEDFGCGSLRRCGR